MTGIITTKHLVTHSMCIISEFGFRCYARCLLKVLSGQKFTFLDMVMS